MSEQDIQKYEKMLLEDPQSRAFAPLAEAYRKVGKLDDAIRVVEAGLKVHPGYTGGLVVLGRAHYEKKELDKAVEVLKKAVTETPESYLGQKFLGKALMDKGEVQDALRALEAANLLSPGDSEVVQLLEEIRPKAAPPKVMEFPGGEVPGGTQESEIVTYEQKPTTVDGVELDPLPVELDEETFSFSDFQVESEGVFVPASADGEDVPDEEDGSVEELGPEAASFIEEAEDLDEVVFSVPAEDNGQPDFREAPEDAIIEKIPAEPEGSALPSRAADPLPAPETEPRQPGDVPPILSEPARPGSGEDAAAAEGGLPAQPNAPGVGEMVARPGEPPLDHSATGGVISTETLADLYAKQGLTNKAAEIYRQILDERPDDQDVMLKLSILEENIRSGEARSDSLAAPPEPEPEKASGEAADSLATLEGWLENAERMKRS